MKKRGRPSLVLPLVTTFVLILLVVIYTARLFYRISVSYFLKVFVTIWHPPIPFAKPLPKASVFAHVTDVCY